MEGNYRVIRQLRRAKKRKKQAQKKQGPVITRPLLFASNAPADPT
jgi:hypothetical protein